MQAERTSRCDRCGGDTLTDLPTPEQAERVHTEPHTPLDDIFGPVCHCSPVASPRWWRRTFHRLGKLAA